MALELLIMSFDHDTQAIYPPVPRSEGIPHVNPIKAAGNLL